MREVKRIINVQFVILTGILLVINALLIMNSCMQDAPLSQVYDEMQQIVLEKQSDACTCKEAAEAAWKEYFSRHEIPYGGMDLTTALSEEQQTARAAREELLEQAVYIDGFRHIVQEKREEAAKLIQSGIYERESFEYVNLLKTRYDLGKIQNLKVSMGNGIWLEKLYEHSFITFFPLLLLWMTVYRFLAERKTGLYDVIHASKNGRAGIFWKRCLILTTEALMLNALFYAESAILLLYRHGGIGAVQQPAAGSECFFLTAGSYTRIEFVWIMILVSAAATAALSMLLWFVLSFFSNINIGVAVYMTACAADILLHLLIAPKSPLRLARYVNVYYLLFPNQAIDYYNWGYSFSITDTKSTMLILTAVMGTGAFAGNIYVALKQYFSGKENKLEAVFRYMTEVFTRLLGSMPAFCMELYKLLVSQKVGVLLIILIFLAAQINAGPIVMYGAVQSYLSQYYEEAGGLRYSSELENVYQQYRLEYEAFVRETDADDPMTIGVIQNKKQMIDAIGANVGYVKAMNASGIDAAVLKPYEYEAALGSAQENNQMYLALLNILAVIVISCGYLSYEKQCGIQRLALAVSGRRRWLVRKYVVQMILIAGFSTLSYGMYYHKLFNTYPMEGLRLPLKSLPMFQNYAWNPTICGFLIADFGQRLILLWALSAVISYSSVYISYLYRVIPGMLLVMPQLLSMLGMNVMDYVSVGRYIAFFPCFYEGGLQWGIYAAVSLLFMTAGGISCIQVFRRDTINR